MTCVHISEQAQRDVCQNHNHQQSCDLHLPIMVRFLLENEFNEMWIDRMESRSYSTDVSII